MNINIKNSIKSYLKTFDIRGCLAVTLTMKQGCFKGRLNEEKSSQNFHHFMNVLNRKVYKQQFKRFNKRLNVIPIIENSYKDRLHLHIILNIPKNIDRNDYINLIKETWNNTDFGYREIDIQPIIDLGWTEYITKFKTSHDDVDWENLHWV